MKKLHKLLKNVSLLDCFARFDDSDLIDMLLNE
jgi:hypothetical protein